MRSQKIGRVTLLKYVLISVGILITTLAILPLINGQDTDVPITLSRILRAIVNEFLENTGYIFTQILIMSVGVWFLGGLTGRLIIEKKRHIYFVGGMTFLALWILLLVGAMLTSGVMNSVKYGGKGFISAVIGWLIYGLIPFLIFGLVHGLAMGYILGNEIRNRGRA